MNIDCEADQIEIYSDCIEDLRCRKIGTEKFVRSIKSAIITFYRNKFSSENDYDIESDIENDLNIMYENFDNLKQINIRSINFFSFENIVKLLTDSPINQASFEIDKISEQGFPLSPYQSTNLNFPYKRKYLNNDFKFTVTSEAGCLLFFDKERKYCMNFKNFNLQSTAKDCGVKNEYVIFCNNDSLITLDFELATEGCEEYDSLDFAKNKGPFIVLHKKYIHKLCINENIERNIKFAPINQIELKITKKSLVRNQNFINYLEAISENKAKAVVTFEALYLAKPEESNSLI